MSRDPYSPPRSQLEHQKPAASPRWRLPLWNALAMVVLAVGLHVALAAGRNPTGILLCFLPLGAALAFSRRRHSWLRIVALVSNAALFLVAGLSLVAVKLSQGPVLAASAYCAVLVVVSALNVVLVARARPGNALTPARLSPGASSP